MPARCPSTGRSPSACRTPWPCEAPPGSVPPASTGTQPSSARPPALHEEGGGFKNAALERRLAQALLSRLSFRRIFPQAFSSCPGVSANPSSRPRIARRAEGRSHGERSGRATGRTSATVRTVAAGRLPALSINPPEPSRTGVCRGPRSAGRRAVGFRTERAGVHGVHHRLPCEHRRVARALAILGRDAEGEQQHVNSRIMALDELAADDPRERRTDRSNQRTQHVDHDSWGAAHWPNIEDTAVRRCFELGHGNVMEACDPG